MNNIKKIAVVTTATLVMSGCGGGGGSSDYFAANKDSENISGTASAPGGVVAQLEPTNVFELALGYIISPAAAAITGLEPVKGADVELIRVDDQGNQIGDVLASTTTSITGDYTLTLPTGVDLAGNLIVRITGTNGFDLRAQVVEKEVDISPASEFVLRKFIESGADLDQLVVSDVVKLSGKVDEFDLTAGADMQTMFEALEETVGAFVENEVAAVSAPGADTSSVAGNYANAAFSLGLHDNDADSYGTFASDIWVAQLSFAAGGEGTVNITLKSEDSAYSNLHGTAINTASPYYEVNSDNDQESFAASLNTKGVLSIPGEFEEDIEGDLDFGWRWPAMSYNFQQVGSRALFFALTHEASVRYRTLDTDNDGIYDALDPELKLGDEVIRNLEVLARKPGNLTANDLAGDYGRVFFESNLNPGQLEFISETNVVSFDEASFDISVTATTAHKLTVNSSGAVYSTMEEAAANDTLTIAADGTIGSEGQVGFVSDDFGYIDFTESDGTFSDDQNDANDYARFAKTMLVKLPTSAPSVSGKKYRLLYLVNHIDGANTAPIIMTASQFNTVMTMASNTAGSVNGRFSDTTMPAGLGSNIVPESNPVELPFTMDIGANGYTVINIAEDAEGHSELEGYFNEDASLGVFNARFVETGGNFDEMGLAVLIEVN